MTARISRERQHQIVKGRDKNLRQLLIRAERTLNGLILKELARRKFTDVRLAHSALLANLDREGNTLTQVAERANISKQAMGQLANELEERGYIRSHSDKADARRRILRFTDPGWALMLATFEALEAIENTYARTLGEDTMNALRTGLAAFIGAHATEGTSASSAAA